MTTSFFTFLPTGLFLPLFLTFLDSPLSLGLGSDYW